MCVHVKQVIIGDSTCLCVPDSDEVLVVFYLQTMVFVETIVYFTVNEIHFFHVAAVYSSLLKTLRPKAHLFQFITKRRICKKIWLNTFINYDNNIGKLYIYLCGSSIHEKSYVCTWQPFHERII